MKLISASLAFSAVYADVISYRLQDSVTEMASLFLSDDAFAAQVFNHGCWCAKIADQGPTSASLGGNQPVDELDQICKDWARERRCSRTDGSICESADFTSTYEIEVSTAFSELPFESCVDSDACSSETCKIDLSFILAIEAWRDANRDQFSPVTNPVCPAHTTSQINNCVAPAATCPVMSWSTQELQWEASTVTSNSCGVPDVVVNALAEVGVDNSDKQLSISGVWDKKDCDFEVFAWQADGVKLNYANLGPLPSTGRIDATNTGILNSDGIAVENIAWVTAPAGTYRIGVENYKGCPSDIDYKLYVQIDGVTTTYERTVEGGYTGQHEVLSFSL